jgi:Peroxin-3
MVTAVVGARYLRRNRRHVILISLAGLGSAAAVWYARRQYRAITTTLDTERIWGAQNLRAVYFASKRTIDSTLRALLKPGRERISLCEGANPDPLVLLLRSSIDGAEKKEVWERLKVSSIVKLLVSIYYATLVYVILLVQVNLVARYSTSNADAPVQDLPDGSLTLESKQRFLSLARRRLFEERGIEELVRIISEATREVVRPVRLSEKVGPEEIRGLLHRICRSVESRGGLELERECEGSNDLAVLSARWLLTPLQEDPADANAVHLVNESLDICDTLGYDDLVRSCVNSVLDVVGDVMDGHISGLAASAVDGKVAFAPLVAKIANLSRLVLDSGSEEDGACCDDLEDSEDGDGTHDGPFIRALLQVPACDAFGAAVFVSGEREGGSGSGVPTVS